MKRIEKLRKEYKTYGKWYYHMTLDSLGELNLFNNREDYINAMNVLAIAQFTLKIGVVQFDYMRNHAHLTLWATGLQCCRLFDYFRLRFNARLIKDGFPGLPSDWFFLLRRLNSLEELIDASSYSARNAYDARKDVLPGGYLWSSNYTMFSEIGALIESKTVGEIGINGMRRLLGSKVVLPSDYKICKLGFVLPESYLMMAGEGTKTKVRSLYKDSKDYVYKVFRDYDTYRKVASDLGETWIPEGGDADSLILNLLNINCGVNDIGLLDGDKRCDLAVMLGTRYGMPVQEIASCLKLSSSIVSKLLYSYSKKHKIQH